MNMCAFTPTHNVNLKFNQPKCGFGHGSLTINSTVTQSHLDFEGKVHKPTDFNLSKKRIPILAEPKKNL